MADDAPAAACTFTMAAEPVVSPCSWNGVMTIYPSETTVVRAVDCQGCGHVQVKHHIYMCPDFIIRSSTSVTTPSTRYQTVCAAATAATATATAAA